MSTELLVKGFFAAILSGVMGWVVFSRCDGEIGEERENEGQRYCPNISGALLPAALVTIVILGLCTQGAAETAEVMLSFCFSVFLHICLYYAVLMLLLPHIRKHISARACATLWMIPNYLYYTQVSYMEIPGPLFVLRAPGKLVWVLFGVWLAGFCIVMLWKLTEHLVFRTRVLRDAIPVTEPAVLEVWNAELAKAGMTKAKLRLVTSPNVTTPMSVGLFRRAIRVVLPERYYAPEELALILRHEIVHIGREDSWSKFFLTFCTAMCWFNPLMWMAMRRSADDLELSCDETVLLDADEEERRRYAGLILSTAGDERGFTTCLSATASALRYRLKSITKPGKRRSGGLVVALTFFLLSMTCGYVALAYDSTTGAEAIYQSQGTEGYTLRSIARSEDRYKTEYEFTDEEAIHAYMAGLSMEKLAGNYSFSDYERQYTFTYDTPGETMWVTLTDNWIKAVRFRGEGTDTYYLPDGVDWDYLDTLIVGWPSLNVYLTSEGSTHSDKIYGSLWTVRGGDGKLLYETDAPDEVRGIYGSYKPERAEFDFSLDTVEKYTVVVESWDGSTSQTVTCGEGESVTLPDHAARYYIYVTYRDESGALCEAQFRFELGDT